MNLPCLNLHLVPYVWLIFNFALSFSFLLKLQKGIFPCQISMQPLLSMKFFNCFIIIKPSKISSHTLLFKMPQKTN